MQTITVIVASLSVDVRAGICFFPFIFITFQILLWTMDWPISSLYTRSVENEYLSQASCKRWKKAETFSLLLCYIKIHKTFE